MFCNQCGTQITDNARFCPKCGCATKVEIPVQKSHKPKKSKGKFNFLRGCISVLCCIMIFFFLFTTLSLFTVRSLISEKNVENILSNLDIAEMTYDTPIETIISEMDGDEIEEVFRKTKLENYVKGVILDYSDYLLGGKEPDGLDSKKIVKIMQDDQEKIEDIIDGNLYSYHYSKIEKFFSDRDNVDFLSPRVRTTPELDTVRIIISNYIIIALIVLTLLFVFLLFLARRFRLDSFVWASVPVILTSIVFTVLFAVKSILLSFCEDFEQFVLDIANTALSGILLPVLTIGGITLITGIIFILIYIIANKIKKSAKNEEENLQANVQ